MARQCILAICLVSVIALNFINCSSNEESNIEVNVAPTLTNVLEENRNERFIHTFGTRTPKGKLLAINHGKLNFDETQDYTFSFGQPESKYMVNFAQVMVDQSSNSSSAYIASGGLGQHNITIVVEAKETTFLHYEYVIFGFLDI